MNKQQKLNAISSILLGMGLTTPVTGMAAVDDANTLPEAKSGECYAKVLVPPVYKTESVESVVSQATEQLTIIPAVYKPSTERILTKEPSTKIEVVDAVYETVEKKIQVSKSSRQWVRDGIDGEVAASAGVLGDLASSGVDLNQVAPNTCFYEHYKPATYKTVEEQVMVTQATEELGTKPSVFEETEKQVMIREASKRLVEVPAVFKTVEDRVLVEPEKSIWKKGRGPIQRIDHATGEIMCLVDIPAVYETFEKRIVAAPPITTTITNPAEFSTIKVQNLATDMQQTRTPVPATYESIAKRELVSEGEFSWAAKTPGDASVMGRATGTVVCNTETAAEYAVVEQTLVKTPGSFKKIQIPAVFQNVQTEELVSDATVTRAPIPELKKSFIRRIKVSDARLEWRPVLCETNMSQDTMLKIQQALADKGYNPGFVDGVLGKGTLDALSKFQKEENLAQGGITYTTLDRLGVKL